MKGLFGGRTHKDINLYFKNFVEVCASLDIDYISQESIRFWLFLFSRMGEAVLWLWSHPVGSITSWVDLLEDFYNQYFPPLNMLQLWDKIINFYLLHWDPCMKLEGDLRRSFWNSLPITYQRRCFSKYYIGHWTKLTKS